MAILEVTDKGKGFAPEILKRGSEDWVLSLGVGLRGMSERLRQLGGELQISSDKGGTQVRATLPVQAPPSAASGSK